MPLYSWKTFSPSLPPPGRYWLAPNATVIGKVSLGMDASIWFGAVARGDHEPIVIGERSNVQENAVLHVDPGCPISIGDDSTIGHAVVLHGCTIGNQVIVGMGAIIMNKAVIGDGSIVGAGSVVTEGKTFAPNSLIVGSPATCIRELSPEVTDKLRIAAEKYVHNWQGMGSDLALIEIEAS